jgi:asparagine synthase (glutamine-hydrolysing)
MPGFLGVYKKSANFVSVFSNCNRLDLINDKIFTESVYLERRTINKFLNDKLFLENEKFIIITEGVILNSKDLIKKYQKNNFGLTVLEMIHQNPDDFFNEFRGSFSGLVYDKQNDCLQIYTDHIGSKQIFYSQTDKGFCFGSEINFLIEFYKESDIQYSFDIAGAYLLLTFGFMLEDHTLFKEFKKLKPGHYLKFQNGIIEIIQFYLLNNTPDYNLSEEEIVNKIDLLFRQAVNREFEKDNEYGYKHLTSLSAGLDSRMTTWVANDLGYGKDIVNMTFSQTNYWDELTPKAISNELKHEWIFKSLDNGLCLNSIEAMVKISSGGILYSGSSHSKSMLDLINTQLFGIMHSGQFGEAIVSTFWRSFNINKSSTLSEWAYSKVLLNRLNPDILKCKYENEEISGLYGRGIPGTNQGLLVYQEYLETFSPFYDIDFMSFCLTIPVELRFGHYIYEKWVVTKYPKAAKYPRNGGSKITGKKPHWIRIGNRYVKSNDLPKRIWNYLLRITGVVRSDTTSKNHMNPFDYWYQTNRDIKDFMDSYFHTNIKRLSEFPELQKDCINMYNNYTIIEKTQVLTLLAVMKLYF